MLNFGIGVGLGGSEINYEKNAEGDKLKVDYRQSDSLFFISFVF